jgi:hypothetical protein
MTPAWGFDLMERLNSSGCITASDAIRIARAIEASNNRITSEIVNRFIEKLI